MNRLREIGLLLRLDLALLAKERIVLVFLMVLPLLGVPMIVGTTAMIARLDLEENSEAVYAVKGPESLRTFVEASPSLRWAEGEAEAELVETDNGLKIVRQDSKEGKKARATLLEVVEKWELEQQRQRWAAAGLPLSPEQVLPVEEVNHGEMNGLLGAMLAQAILFWALVSGIYIATDLIAGERERGTMETLLSAPPSRESLLTAKFLGLFVVVQLIAVNVLASAIFSVRMGWLDAAPIPASAWLLTFLASLPLSVLLAAALLIAGALIPDFRSGQAIALPILLGGLLLAMVSMIPNVSLSWGTALIPISGVSLLFRELLVGPVPFGLLVWTLAAGFAEAALVVLVVARTVSREGLLFGARGGPDRHARGEFGREVAVAYLLLIGLFFALGLPAQAADLVWGMLVTQIGVFAGFAVVFLLVLGQPLRATLAFGRPSLRDLGLAVVLGCTISGAAMLVQLGQALFLPAPKDYAAQFVQSLTLDIPLWATIALFAVLPGICEELVFRGAFQGLLRRSMKPWAVAVVVGGLFGLIHLDPPRILPVATIGVLLCVARQRSGSLWVPIIAHTLNNAILMTLIVTGGEPPEPPVLAMVLGAAAAGVAILGMRGNTR